jgi:TRAP-type C4-dicarboxylate transport system permease small subunit
MDAYLEFSRKVQETLQKVLGTLSALMMLGLTAFSILEIVRRYIFSVVFEWGQDAIVVGMVSAVSIFFCVTQTRRSHLVMNAVIQLLHMKEFHRTVGFSKIIVSAVIAIFCMSICVTGWDTLEYAYRRELSTESLVLPLWPFYLTLMCGFGLMGFVAFLQTIEDMIAFARGEHFTAGIELTTDV